MDIDIQPGQPIHPDVWTQLQRGVRSGRLVGGPGVRLDNTFGPTAVSFKAPAVSWAHAFQVALSGNSAGVRFGLVNGVEPTIAGVPISGNEDDAVPRLSWNAPKLDADGRGWIALEVTCGVDWEILSAEIVQVSDLDADDGLAIEGSTAAPGYVAGGAPGLPDRRARHPLAMLRRRSSGQLLAFQITYFHLQHRVAVAAAGGDLARHFFCPAG